MEKTVWPRGRNRQSEVMIKLLANQKTKGKNIK